MTDFKHLSGSVVELTASFEVAPYRREKRVERELHLEPAFLPRESKEAGSVPFPRFQAFLYALTQNAVSVLRSDSGQSTSGTDKEKRKGRHIEITLSR